MKKLCTMFTAILLFCSMSVMAQTNRFSNGTEGTEFWFSFPVCWAQSGEGNDLKIYVSCEVATQCTLEIPGLGKKVVYMTKPHDVIEFTLFPGEGQPYEKNDNPTTAQTEEQTFANGKGRGIHVYADVPITVYGVSRFVYTSDSFIALPTSSLGTEYIVASYADVTAPYAGQHLMSQTVVVAAYDSTTVTFKLGGSPGTQTVGGMTRGQTKTFVLNKGDVVAFANKKISGNNLYLDLSGSKITSDKPIAVTSGNQCAYVPVTTPACDFIMEMELPTNTWGKEYHVSRFIKRKNYSFMKIFAKNPNTKLYRDGSDIPFATLTTAGGYQGTGYYEGRILDDGLAPRPIVIKGDGPISITLYNTGQSDDGVQSDPFQLVLTPIEQYQKEISFNTPGIKGGQGFKENYVNLVYEANADSTMPDDLEFGILQNDTVNWRPVRNIFGATAEPFKGFAGDTKKYCAKIISLPGDGVYKFRALKPFAAYAYGFDNYDSYGHPTSLITNDLTESDTIPPTIVLKEKNGASESFTMEDPGVRPSKISRIFLNPSASVNYRLKTDKFTPGQAPIVGTIAEVIDPSKDAKAEIVVVDRAGNHSTTLIEYEGKPTRTYSVNDVNFGLAPVNIQLKRIFTIQNTGQLAITLYSHTLPASAFYNLVNWPAFPIQVQPNEILQLEVAFWSPTAETFKDSVLFTSDAGNFTVHFTATTIKGTLQALGYIFGKAKVGEEKTGYVRLTNMDNISIRILSIESPKNSAFSWSTAGNIDIAPGEVVNLPVKFMSNIPGDFTDTMKIVTNDGIIHAIVKGSAENPSGVERVYDPSFNITPNPASGFTTINLPSFKSQNPLLKVYDALGNEVADFTGKVTGEYVSFNFDTRSLPNGAYFVRFTDGKYTLIRTFIVNN